MGFVFFLEIFLGEVLAIGSGVVVKGIIKLLNDPICWLLCRQQAVALSVAMVLFCVGMVTCSIYENLHFANQFAAGCYAAKLELCWLLGCCCYVGCHGYNMWLLWLQGL